MKEKKAQEENEKRLAALKLKTSKITGALQWYNQLLDDLNATAASVVDGSAYDESDDEDEEKKEDGDTIKVKEESSLIKNRPKNALTAEQVIAALEKCDSDELLEDIDTKIGKITYFFLCLHAFSKYTQQTNYISLTILLYHRSIHVG